MLENDLKVAALEYHAKPIPGKLTVSLSKPASTQRELSLAYSPGVAAPVLEIQENPLSSYLYTNRGNLVAVISNGTAVLGLGDVGALASKPVMEGKAVLFKQFADVDVFDIEIATRDPDAFIETVVNIAPTFGGINLEDIKAPDCFYIEKKLMERLDIPVFHDDQHGTAIIVAAGLLNALELQQKKLDAVKIVCVGAGAAAIASLNLLLELGANKETIYLFDTQGLVHQDRSDLNEYKRPFAKPHAMLLEEALIGADVVLGVARGKLLTPELLKQLADKPIVFALANPEPEIRPELAHSIRKDIIVATGRSDYPNQVNNVLCFPFLFKGALNARATRINREMHIAAVHAIRLIAHDSVPAAVLAAYENIDALSFGRDYILPKPFDPRLKTRVTQAVYTAAVNTGVAKLS